jgi:receptor expression-enhancing protein 5/6
LSCKAVERKSSDDVREWACYWTVLATLYCLQPFIDLLASWLPFYYLAKVRTQLSVTVIILVV